MNRHWTAWFGTLCLTLPAAAQSMGTGEIVLDDEWPSSGPAIISAASGDHLIFGGPNPYRMFGHSVTAGDFNGDGEIDVAISARHEKDIWGNNGAGSVYLFINETTTSGGFAFSFANAIRFRGVYGGFGSGDAGGDISGNSLTFVDLDDDGNDELVIGSLWSVDLSYLVGGASCTDCIDDANGTGSCCGDSNSGRIHVIYGTSSVSSHLGNDYFLTDADDPVIDDPIDDVEIPASQRLENTSFDSVTFRTNQFGSKLGQQVISIGDIDGDGVEDLSFADASYADCADPTDCQSGEDPGAGAVYVVYGLKNGDRYDGVYRVPDHIDAPRPGAAPEHLSSNGAYFVGSQGSFTYLGYAGEAGDFDGDGYGDLLLGETRTRNPFPANNHAVGAAYLIWGGAGSNRLSGGYSVESLRVGLSGASALGVAMIGDAKDDKTGWRVTGVGDLDDDGYDDIAIAAPGWEGGNATNSGAVWIVKGRSTRITAPFQLSTSTATWLEFTTSAGERQWLGWELVPGGDLNNDGYADFIVGAPGFKNGLGWPDCDGNDCVTDGRLGYTFVVYGHDGFADSIARIRVNALDGTSTYQGARYVVNDVSETYDALTTGFGLTIAPLTLGGLNDPAHGMLVGAPGYDDDLALGTLTFRGRAFLIPTTGSSGGGIGGRNAPDPIDRAVQLMQRTSSWDANRDGIIDARDVRLLLGLAP